MKYLNHGKRGGVAGLRRWCVMLFLVSVCVIGQSATAWALATVTQLRLTPLQEKTLKLTLLATKEARYQVMTLGNPYRVVLDFPDTVSPISAHALSAQKQLPIITNLRRSYSRAKDLRIVIDLAAPVQISAGSWTAVKGGKYQFTLTFKLQEGTTLPDVPKTVAAPTLPVAPANAKTPSVSSKEKKPLIMIDPGHGGEDPGAIGRGGVQEKHLTLRYAAALRKALEKTGRYRVAVTRSGDYFIRLNDRVEKARKANADIFISLHADSHADPAMQGLSVYTLSETASDKEAELLAMKESKSDILKGVNLDHESHDITNVLIDLMQRETKNISVGFAECVVRELAKEIRLLRNTHRFAGFKVLKGIDIPAVLIELGYLSNPQEEKRLDNESYRQKIVRSLMRAVDKHFALNKAVPAQ